MNLVKILIIGIFGLTFQISFSQERDVKPKEVKPLETPKALVEKAKAIENLNPGTEGRSSGEAQVVKIANIKVDRALELAKEMAGQQSLLTPEQRKAQSGTSAEDAVAKQERLMKDRAQRRAKMSEAELEKSDAQALKVVHMDSSEVVKQLSSRISKAVGGEVQFSPEISKALEAVLSRDSRFATGGKELRNVLARINETPEVLSAEKAAYLRTAMEFIAENSLSGSARDLHFLVKDQILTVIEGDNNAFIKQMNFLMTKALEDYRGSTKEGRSLAKSFDVVLLKEYGEEGSKKIATSCRKAA